MRDAYEVIVKPIITEKSTRQIDEGNVYAFVVAEDANKVEIGRAVEKIWDVTVQGVRTMRYPGKARRSFLGRMSRNRNTGRRPSFKKALVTLSDGDYIEFYDAG